MRLPRTLHTTSFRLAALYAVMFALSAGVLLAIVYWTAAGVLREQVRLSIENELYSFDDRTAEALAAEVAQRQMRLYYYGVWDAGGNHLVGALPPLKSVDGWQLVSLPDHRTWGNSNHVILALGRHLPDGGVLAVGADLRHEVEAAEAIARSFLSAGGAALLFALAGGILLSRGFLRRIDAINRTTRAIMAGDLSNRIEGGSSRDELDQLAANLNAMLDRLQALMEGVRQVSNDIAHDLRTPLSRLRQRLETARIEASTIADYEEAVDRAIEDADTALATFGAMLRIAQIESGCRRRQFCEVDLSVLLSDLARTYAPVAEDLGKRLVDEIETGLRVRGDRELLTQMFVNLIENGLRHTPDGATVHVCARADRAGPVAEVKDNGRGVPEAEREKVLQRFYRLETSRSTQGSGLGLSLVAAVADLHDAGLELSDNRPGLKVTLRFNSARDAAARAPAHDKLRAA